MPRDSGSEKLAKKARIGCRPAPISGKSVGMTDYERIERVIRHLDKNYRDQPRLADLARVAGVSEFHFHRLFSRWAGTTPKSFLKYLTAEHAKGLLRESRDLLDVSLETGLSGPGRLHDLLISVEGVSPGEYKAQGAGLEIRYGFHDTPFGRCLIAQTERGICHVAFVAGTSEKLALTELKNAWANATFKHDQRLSGKAATAIFKPAKENKLSLLLSGTTFQIKVWEALLRIPPGRVLSYGDVATLIGKPAASRAVGTAIGKNAIAYLIPCHRVIRETGVIGDYRWGQARKKLLLAWEKSAYPANSPG